MSGVNKVILVGNLGRDPDVRTTQGGTMVVSFSIATSESWRDKATGERKERVDWHNVVIFNEGLGKVAEQYLKKGSKVYVEGKMQTREYDDRDGVKRKTTEVVLQPYRGELTLLDTSQRPAPDADSYGKVSSKPQQQHYDDPRMAMGERRTTADIIDDDIPF